ncbi:MAG TPA: GNAT family protein [Anaeromyxobacteraceae bacterium]|nr:GNAT family protein [Anaeromyxobacteraceae bacterium]
MRLLLRGPTAADRDEFLARVRDSRSLHRPWVHPPATAAAYATWLRRAGPEFLPLLACRRGDGALVGVVALSGIALGNFRSAYLEYYVFRPFQHQGYMTDALQETLRLAFRRLGLHRLEANVQPGNAASLRLVRRCGFRREGFSPRYLLVGGRWRDHERWAVRADQHSP